ncbi:hypothetical protein POM88_045696 [Heracleum sosnowskyi]|uniref:Homologous recombination OB-fold protein OB-fold domain-containing protein n=1 Tax=Heracleum sosnowskyi TaxID=360622 RepID=A0AAD8H4Z3_9APIA|nr:hypothetical protein POM88_045696 [Heracleum sosnowskyi]
MEKNWESLDVDDSDLPSLTLRPCSNSNKKHHHNNSSSSSSQHTPPLLSPRFIPGPAGIIQSAMNRKRLHDSDPPISTQDFLLQAAECSENDDDFNSNAWLHALHFTQTTKDVVIPTTPLSRVDTTLPHRIVNQVVAIINSCTPNGLGDMTVTLKDRTGIRDGTIHRKVLTDSEFAKDISVKAAIVLKKVSIFAPASKTVYLNITRSNVLKVFRKDIEPLSGNTHVAPRVSYRPPDISKKSRILEDAFAEEQGRTKETMHEACQMATDATEICVEAGVDVPGDDQVTLDSSEKRPARYNFSEGHKSSVFVGNLNEDHEVEQADKAVKQRSMSKVSLPQWTDEQLLALFNDDDPLP